MDDHNTKHRSGKNRHNSVDCAKNVANDEDKWVIDKSRQSLHAIRKLAFPFCRLLKPLPHLCIDDEIIDTHGPKWDVEAEKTPHSPCGGVFNDIDPTPACSGTVVAGGRRQNGAKCYNRPNNVMKRHLETRCVLQSFDWAIVFEVNLFDGVSDCGCPHDGREAEKLYENGLDVAGICPVAWVTDSVGNRVDDVRGRNPNDKLEYERSQVGVTEVHEDDE